MRLGYLVHMVRNADKILAHKKSAGAREGDVEIVKYNPAELKRKCRRMVEFDKKGNIVIRNELKDQLKRIFP